MDYRENDPTHKIHCLLKIHLNFCLVSSEEAIHRLITMLYIVPTQKDNGEIKLIISNNERTNKIAKHNNNGQINNKDEGNKKTLKCFQICHTCTTLLKCLWFV